MEDKKERTSAVSGQEDKTDYPVREYRIPELAEAYHDDSTRSMGYEE